MAKVGRPVKFDDGEGPYLCRGGCGRYLRRRSERSTFDPGTVAVYKFLMCEGCMRHHYPTRVARKKQVQEYRRHLDSIPRFIAAERAARGVPPQGYDPARLVRR